VKKQQATGWLAAGVVLGGTLAGTLGAHAADSATDSATDRPPHIRVHFGGPGGDDLAKELGVSQAKLRSAMESIGDELRPAKRPDGPPSASEMKAMEDKFATALADKLGLSKAKVEAALAKVRKAHEAEHRSNLSDRLDEAVQAGKLTADDKASVLKAFDAGVLFGGPGVKADEVRFRRR